MLTESAVGRYFSGRNVIGETITINQTTTRTIVGIVADVRHGGPEWEVRPESFVPFVQGDQPSAALIARAGPNAAAVGRAVQEAVRRAVPSMVAGDPERKAMARHAKEGIAVAPNMKAQIRALAADAGAPWLLESEGV